MILKLRKVPINLRIRRYLKLRMSFSDRELGLFLADEKGYDGECRFDHFIAQSHASTYLQFQDLLLQWHNSSFQIDSLLISPHKIYLFDVKNHKGEVYIEGERWYYFSGDEMKNPLHQLERCESLLRPLLQSLGIHLPIEANVVFINPEFTLFQANKNLPIILPTQINSFLRKLGLASLKSNDQNLMQEARQLALLHNEDSLFSKSHIPAYTYESLKKGIPCIKCGLLSAQLCGRELVCEGCGCKENLVEGVLRSVEEHRILFPSRLITVSGMNDWCCLDLNRTRMQRILGKNLRMVGNRKSAYYR